MTATGLRSERLRRVRLGLSPLALAGWLAVALLVFGLFYLLGRVTAESRTTLRAATPVAEPAGESKLGGLFRAEALPPLGGEPAEAAARKPVAVAGTSRPARADVIAGADGVVPAFAVSYRLRALATSVRIESLTLSGLVPGASVEVRCLRACTIAERRIAPATGELTSTELRGWLKRGAVFELEARRPGRIGAYASVTVTGLPRGLSIERACLPSTGPPIPTPCRRFSGR
jgi:hypothetical protein